MPSLDTKNRILDVAERLFAEQGIAETSLRLLTAEADVNLAAVHYHFGSKDKLIREVVGRRFQPINHERLELLDQLEDRSEAIQLEDLLRIFFGPPLRLTARDTEGTACLRKLIGRVQMAGGRYTESFHEVFREVQQRFVPAGYA